MAIDTSDVEIVSDIDGDTTPGLYLVDGSRVIVLPNDHSYDEFTRIADLKVKRFISRSLLYPILGPISDPDDRDFIGKSIMYRKVSNHTDMVNAFRDIPMIRQFIGAFIRTSAPYGDMSDSEIKIIRNSIRMEMVNNDVTKGVRLGRNFIPSESLIAYADKVGAHINHLDSGLVNISYFVRYDTGSFDSLHSFVEEFPIILSVFDKLIKRFPLCQIYSTDLPDFEHL